MKGKLTIKYHHLSPKFLLKLMEIGARVELPTGFVFQGDVANKYIDVGMDLGTGRMVKDGCWNMTVEGAKNAIADAKKYELEQLNNS